ncbi:unnamed protein product, partial [Didymodactylos carnosus]
KLKRQGIPIPYVNWIHAWLIKRRAVIEIAGVKSRWFEIMRGGPQGSSFTATLFITYHADMEYFIPEAMSFLFADDLAAVLAGQIGIKFAQQCIDLEKRLHIFFEQLEFYAVLTVQKACFQHVQLITRTQCLISDVRKMRLNGSKYSNTLAIG